MNKSLIRFVIIFSTSKLQIRFWGKDSQIRSWFRLIWIILYGVFFLSKNMLVLFFFYIGSCLVSQLTVIQKPDYLNSNWSVAVAKKGLNKSIRLQSASLTLISISIVARHLPPLFCFRSLPSDFRSINFFL